jgi:hypothetical protein
MRGGTAGRRSVLLAALALLATGSALRAQPQIRLDLAEADGRLTLTAWAEGAEAAGLRFALAVEKTGPGGTARSRQEGTVAAGAGPVRLARLVLNAAPGDWVAAEAELRRGVEVVARAREVWPAGSP